MTTETHPEKDPLATDTDSMHFALNAAGIGIWDMDPVRQMVKWDNRCRELYGFPEEEILSYTDVVHYIHPEDREQVAHAVALALDPALRQEYETRFRTVGVKDGKLRWLLCKGKAYFDEQGVAYRFSGTAQDITELVLTLEKANTAEQLTHLAIDSTEAGSFFVDLDTNAIRYSPRLAWIFTGSEQTSLSREDLIRQIHPDDRQKRKNAYLEAERTGKVFFDARTVWQDGTVRYIRSSGAYIYDLAGRAIAFSGIVHDITAAEEGKAEEQKLSAEVAASEQRFRTMIEHSPIAICLFSGRDLVIEIPNEAMIQLIGKGRDIAGKKLADVMPELQGQPYLQILDDVFTTRKAFHTDASRVHIVRDGKVTDNYYSFSYTPLVNAEGAVYAILEMAMDVTGNILAQQQITETETKLRNAIDSAWLGTWEINLETGDIVLSERARGWLGYTAADAITFEDMLSSIDDSGIIADVFRDTAAGKRGGSLNVEYRIINRQSGRLVYLRVLGQAFYRQSGEAYLMSGIMQDITLQKNTEKELERQVQERTEELALTIEELSTSNEDLYLAKTNLEQSNYELEQYAYVASHDLQEPLRKIRVFSEILNERNDIPGDAKITLSKVIHSSERMSLLIKDLLQFSTLLHGEKNTAEVDLGKVIRSVISDFELLITEKGAQIDLEDLPVIEAIPLQMNQLFYNLLSNALKFSRKDTPPQIRIRAEKAAASDLEDLNYTDHNNTYFRITFTDNGIGFSQEYAEQVFEVFKRLQTKSVYQGTGIGLSVCRRIAQQHYGTIYARSEEDKGTQFVIILPVVQPGK